MIMTDLFRSRRRTIAEDGPQPVDIHVGQKLREFRTLRGLSQDHLAQALDISFQQVQKYERGANRISASRLHQLSAILGVPVGAFFEDLAAPTEYRNAPGVDAEFERMASRETLELVRAYYEIEDAAVRKRLIDFVRTLGKSYRSMGRG